MKKRIVTLLLKLTLLAALLSIGALAADGDKLIAFTFDDGPSQYTAALLDGLAERDAKVTFFVQGINASTYSSTVSRAWQEGHQICSHTYNHAKLTSLSTAGVREQVTKTDTILDSALGFDATYLLRPPYGAYNQSVLNTVGVPCFYWSVDTRDWESRNSDAVYNMILKYAKDGAVVLMHDIHATTIPAALRAIDTLQAQGYEFVTVSELFYRRGVSLASGNIYFSAYPGSAGTADGVAEPTISCENSTAGKVVTISGDSRGTVYYTTNGELPTPANSTQYTGPFTLTSSATVRAVSVIDWNSIRSDTVTQQVDYTPAAAPELTLSDDGTLSMTSATAGAVIYYTTDGSDPTDASTVYTGPIAAEMGTTYRARAYAPSYDASAVSQLTWGTLGSRMCDVSTQDWYYETCDRAMAEGLISGTGTHTFAPNQQLSRAMLVTILYRMAGSPEGAADCAYPDADADSYYYAALCWASEQGIISGYSDGTFGPDKSVTREELCCMLARYFQAQGMLPEDSDTGTLAAFTDGDNVSEWARTPVRAMCEVGALSGYSDGSLRPGSGATRAEAMAILYRAADALTASAGE